MSRHAYRRTTVTEVQQRRRPASRLSCWRRAPGMRSVSGRQPDVPSSERSISPSLMACSSRSCCTRCRSYLSAMPGSAPAHPALIRKIISGDPTPGQRHRPDPLRRRRAHVDRDRHGRRLVRCSPIRPSFIVARSPCQHAPFARGRGWVQPGAPRKRASCWRRFVRTRCWSMSTLMPRPSMRPCGGPYRRGKRARAPMGVRIR